MSERKKHIAVLKEMLAWMNMSSEIIEKDDPFFRVHEHRKKAVKYAISSLETDEAYQLEYESTTKNDLGVDCISRKAVLEMAKSYNADGWDMYTPLVVDVEDIEELPPVTPIRPKGHWICDGKGRSFADYHCSKCGLKLALCGQDIKQRQDSGYSVFCDGCGADMREVVEE